MGSISGIVVICFLFFLSCRFLLKKNLREEGSLFFFLSIFLYGFNMCLIFFCIKNALNVSFFKRVVCIVVVAISIFIGNLIGILLI